MAKRFGGVVGLLLMTACGPDATGLVGEGADADEVETSTGELTATSTATTWFPMAEGNSWTFEAPGASRTVTLTSVGNGMGRLEGLFAEATWVGVSSGSKNTLFGWDAASSTWSPFVRFGYAVTGWQYQDGTCKGLKLKRLATGTQVSGAAGAFSDTRVISVNQLSSPTARCAAPAFTELTFAADTGLVAFRTGSGERFVLTSAVVNGRRLPSGAGAVTATLALDQPRYVNAPNTIRCIRAPCPSNAVTAKARATFTVTNSTTSTFTWRFNTGCQFDLDVAATTGSVVRRLSDGRFCTMALTQLTLAPGDVKTYTAELPLEDKAGLQLDGTFRATARLLGTGGPAVSGATGFIVSMSP